MAAIQPLRPTPSEIPALRESIPSERVSGFGDALRAVVEGVDDLHREKDGALHALATGQSPDIHSTMIAVQRADIAFKLTMQVRNKAISAYQEIMRMNL